MDVSSFETAFKGKEAACLTQLSWHLHMTKAGVDMVKQEATWLVSSSTVSLLSLFSPSFQFKLLFSGELFSPVQSGERKCEAERETVTGRGFSEEGVCSLKYMKECMDLHFLARNICFA